MIRIQQIKMPLKHDKKDLELKIRKLLRLKPDQVFTYGINKQSIDARRKNEVAYVYTVDVQIEFVDLKKADSKKADLKKADSKKADLVKTDLQKAAKTNSSNEIRSQEEKIIKRAHNKNIMLTEEVFYVFPKAGQAVLKHRPVIAGSGPAGLFCAYLLALHGYQPIIIERGRSVEDRQKDVEKFWQDGILDPSSNVQFGEGGAGTFSDGKLNTLVKDHAGRNRFVLDTFVQCGADENILYINKPHIGTDQLIRVVKNMREKIQHLGGDFYFETCLKDFQTENGRICSVTIEAGGKERQLETELLVLAVGHSARDTFEMLHRNHLPMEAKAFAVGFRVEHPQDMIDLHQYKGASMDYLPPASYKVTAPYNMAADRRSIYSFCMCPGGFVVNASSEAERLAVNGMSYHRRDGSNANSAVIVSVTPQDFPDVGAAALRGIEFQRQLEGHAYVLGAGKIPQQLYGDLKAGRVSTGYGGFASQTKGACAFADLGELLPHGIKEAWIYGMERFADYIPEFNRYDAIVSGIESRTSSPVRILRDAQGESMTGGIYPCGEGAGYAGGIMSAAMDGIKTAEKIAMRFQYKR